MLQLFSFPNPVNETSARLVAGTVAVLAVVTVAFQQGWLLPVLAYGCVGCRVFYLGMRLGLVPPQVCEECVRVLTAAAP